MKRQARDGETIFAKQTSNRGLVSRIYNDLSKFNSEKIQLENEQRQERHFTEKDICRANNYMKTCFLQIKNHDEISLCT